MNQFANSHEKFEQLFFVYKNLLYGIGMRILNDPITTEDAMQQCFIRIYKNLDKINDITEARTKSFVCRIMNNEAIRIYHIEKGISDFVEPLDDTLIDIEDETLRVDEILAKAELQDEVGVYLDALKPAQKEILILKYILGLSDQEIERTLDVSGDLIRKRISRARKQLAKVVAAERKRNRRGE